MSQLFDHITIIGLGQIGGSLALAIKEAGAAGHVTGYDLDPQHGAFLLEREAIHHLSTDLAEAVAQADIVIFCTPVSTYGTLLQQCAHELKPGAIVTDVGSVKVQAIRDLAAHMPGNVYLIPSHPIAGSERSGAAVARAGLFDERPFIITPLEGMEPETIDPVRMLWDAIGAKVVLLPPPIHDQIYAYTSHVPHLLSFAANHVLFTNSITNTPDPLFQRFVRIGRSEPQMWRDVFLENKHHIIKGVDQVLYLLNHMRGELLSNKDETAEPSLDDQAIATNLFPRIVASVMVSALSMCEQQLEHKLLGYTGAGFHDLAAPATEAPEMDLELISNHAPQVAGWIEKYVAELEALHHAITHNDGQALLTLIQNMRRSALALVEAS